MAVTNADLLIDSRPRMRAGDAARLDGDIATWAQALMDEAAAAHQELELRLRTEVEYRMRAEKEAQTAREALRAAEDQIERERAANAAIQSTFAELRAAEASVRETMMAERVARAEAQARLDAYMEHEAQDEEMGPPDAPSISAPQDDARMQTLLDAVQRMESAYQGMDARLRSAMTQPSVPQPPATYSLIPRRDGAGVIREIVATPV